MDIQWREASELLPTKAFAAVVALVAMAGAGTGASLCCVYPPSDSPAGEGRTQPGDAEGRSGTTTGEERRC